MRPAPPGRCSDRLFWALQVHLSGCLSSSPPCQPRSRFRRVTLSLEGGFSSVGHLDPLRVRRGLGVVVVVPVPPLVRRGLGVALLRVLPLLLTTEGRHIEVAPVGSHRLVAAAVDEVFAAHPLAVSDEY